MQMIEATQAPRQQTAILILRRLEGAAIATAAIVWFAQISGDWWLFALLFLVPDIAMLFYLFGPRPGAIAYNSLHTYVMPVALAGVGLFWDSTPILAICSIWVAHIGIDRAFGFGLKYTSGFHHTHLSFRQNNRSPANTADETDAP